MILTAITLYPVKSCGGLALPHAILTPYGLMTGQIRDREWVVVDQHGNFLSQREYPRIALIVPRLSATRLELCAAGAAPLPVETDWHTAACAQTVPVVIWGWRTEAYDCGDAAAAWLSAVIGVACRLARFHPDRRRQVDPRWTGEWTAHTLFADGFPVLLAGSASLDDLNQKLMAAGRAAVPMERFRPNLVIEGIDAFEEDYVDTFQFGEVELKPVKPCSRCTIPSIDQTTGHPGPDPLDILQSYRKKPQLDDAICFGMNSIVISGAGRSLYLGQEVTANLAF